MGVAQGQPNDRVPRVIGLTGGIGSGKSTVAAMFRELGAAVVDADKLARRVVEPGSGALAEIVERFGPEILTGDGELDRKRLGEIVFNDELARKALNAITHPRIGRLSQQEIAKHAEAGAELVLYEAALIVENRLHEWMAGLIVVSVPPEIQLRRLVDRDEIDRESAQARIEAQLPLEDKCAPATFVIDNSGDLDATRERVREVWEQIRG